MTFDSIESFTDKVKTLRESYFNNKDAEVGSVVTDSPVEELTEETKKNIDLSMARYMSALNAK